LKPNRIRAEESKVLHLEGCAYTEFVNDGFLTVMIRSDGIPVPENIALLRNFILKLNFFQDEVKKQYIHENTAIKGIILIC